MSVITVTNDNFHKEVLDTSDKVLIDFWASWCGPCKMMSPIIDEIAEENIDGLKVCKINVDEENELASHFSIQSIPTLMLIKDKEIKNKSVGLVSKEDVMQLINK